jgi:citrate lyase subunit beta/citryl-CoA lyase
MIEKAAASDADLAFLDLEDAVVPDLKVPSRDNVVEGLEGLDWGRTLRAVRVNSADTEWATEDVLTVVEKAGQHLDILIVPKVKAPRDVWFFETLLEQLETKLRLPKRIGIEILIEEAEALSRVEEIAACSPRLEALILGFGDLAASLGIRIGHEQDPSHRYPGDLWHGARSRMIAAAQRPRRHRRTLSQLPGRGRLPPRGDLGEQPGRGGKVVHPPGADRDRQ